MRRSAQMLSSQICNRTRSLKAIGIGLLHPSPCSPCYFLADPQAPVNRQGSRPHPKAGAIKMSNDSVSLFSLFQAGQPKWGSWEVLRTGGQPETQREFEKNKNLTGCPCPLRLTLMDTLQSQSGCCSSVISGRSVPSQRRSLSVEPRIMRVWFLASPELCLCNIHQQLQSRGQGKQIGKNNDNNSQSVDWGILKMRRTPS